VSTKGNPHLPHPYIDRRGRNGGGVERGATYQLLIREEGKKYLRTFNLSRLLKKRGTEEGGIVFTAISWMVREGEGRFPGTVRYFLHFLSQGKREKIGRTKTNNDGTSN